MKKLFLFIISLLSISLNIIAQAKTNIELPAIISTETIIKHFGYTLSYNENHEQANWVAYELTADETQKKVKRSNIFRMDDAVKTGSATNVDYKGSGYGRGHLAPAADMGWSVQSMEESFFYSNMSPQVPGFNRGIWKKLEEQVRQWAVDNKAVYVVTGPVLENNLHTIGTNHISVPRYYYKVILDYTEPELKGIGFLMPNTSSSLPLQHFAVSIDSVEHVTGINFFPALRNKQEQNIETKVCLNCWTWTSAYSQHHKNAQETISKELGIIHRCSATTKSGTRCKRMTSNLSGFCTQHKK